VTGTRLTLAIVLGIGLAAPAVGHGDGKGFLHRKTPLDPARIRQLVETVRGDPDEKKRKAAVSDLLEADPRLQLEVMPTLITALRKDTSPAVRAAAAEVIGRYGVVFPTGGLALEDAIESDPALAVRNAAKQALWEYHLIGYRSAKSGSAMTAQTAEPPIARPAGPSVPVTSEPPTALAVVDPFAISTPTISSLPPIAGLPGPRVASVISPAGPGTLISAIPPHPNLTVEPPFAKSSVATVSVPTATVEPPIRPRWHEPVTFGAPPPLALDLPPIVPPPGPIPGVIPFPEQTAEPPIRKLPASPGGK
jgi:HEAT repeats